MARDALFPSDVPPPAAPYSPAVRSGDHVFVSGQVGFDERGALVSGGVEEQTARAIANLAACLAAAGCTLADVVKIGAFLLDLDDFDAFNDAYRRAFSGPFPARTTVQAGLPAGSRVEIDAIARIPTP
jgi:2-iminobutanoate/2-iminopropanoate deaminase